MAILHLHAASFSWPRNGRSILLSEESVCAPEHQGSAELPRTPLWRSSRSGHSEKFGVTKGVLTAPSVLLPFVLGKGKTRSSRGFEARQGMRLGSVCAG